MGKENSKPPPPPREPEHNVNLFFLENSERAARRSQSERTTLLLLGKTGAGKSCLGNKLLGDSAQTGPFEPSPGIESQTSDFQMEDGFFCGDKSRPIRVIDSPGFADSKGGDNKFPEKLSEIMEKVEYVNVLLWCRNGAEDRIDDNDLKQLKSCQELFGTYLFENMVMNLSKWPHDQGSENRRKKSGKSFFNFRQELWKKILQLNDLENKKAFPVFPLDAMFDEENDEERTKFDEIKEDMWLYFQNLASKPVFTEEALNKGAGGFGPMFDAAVQRSRGKRTWWVLLLEALLKGILVRPSIMMGRGN